MQAIAVTEAAALQRSLEARIERKHVRQRISDCWPQWGAHPLTTPALSTVHTYYGSSTALSSNESNACE